MSKTLSLLSWENAPTTSPWWARAVDLQGFYQNWLLDLLSLLSLLTT